MSNRNQSYKTSVEMNNQNQPYKTSVECLIKISLTKQVLICNLKW